MWANFNLSNFYGSILVEFYCILDKKPNTITKTVRQEVKKPARV